MNDLHLLFDNKIDCIVVDDFFSSEMMSAFLSVLVKQPEWKEAEVAKVYEHLFVNKPIPKHLFASQYMVLSYGTTEDQYLERCKNYSTVWKKITTECGFDPFQHLVDYLKNAFHVDVQLAAKLNSTYSPIVVRDLSEEVLPHADYGPYDGKNWAIDQVTKQLAWNIYLTHPGEGGDTVVFDYVWDNELDVDESSYGIENLDKPIKVKFSVKPGRLVMFNSRNFHAVGKSSAPRIAIGGLLGLTGDGRIIAWS